jgi:FlaA1/EpsC-like NDP-sugar epimerase
MRIVAFWAFAIALVLLLRAVARTWFRQHPAYVQNTVIVGAGDVGQLVARKLMRHPEYGINLVGFVDTNPLPRHADLRDLRSLGSLDRLPTVISVLNVERVIIAFSTELHTDLLHLMRSIKDLDVQVDVVPRLFDIVGPNVTVHQIEGVPLLGMPPTTLPRTSKALKRLVDVTLSVGGLMVLAPCSRSSRSRSAGLARTGAVPSAARRHGR